jgi:hypothetical protein
MACWTYLDVHQVLHAGASEFWKLHAALAQKCRDVIAFFALRCSDTWKPSSRSVTHLDGFAMTAPIPEGISDLDSLGFYPLLLRQPVLAQCLSFDAFLLFSPSIRQEGRVNVRILGQPCLFGAIFLSSAGHLERTHLPPAPGSLLDLRPRLPRHRQMRAWIFLFSCPSLPCLPVLCTISEHSPR